MGRRRWRWRVIGAVVATVLVSGCGGIGPGPKSGSGGGPGDDGEGVESVPIHTTWFAAGTTAGAVVYRTNDPKRTGARGGSDWHMGTVRQEPMGSVEVEVSKRSGDAESFRALINGGEVEQVRNDGGIRLTGGGFGHLVSLSPNEAFPEVAVHVEFRQITPREIGLVTGAGERSAVRTLGAWR